MTDVLLTPPHAACPIRVHAPYNATIFVDDEEAAIAEFQPYMAGAPPTPTTPARSSPSDSSTDQVACSSGSFGPGYGYDCYTPDMFYPHHHRRIAPRHAPHSPYTGGMAQWHQRRGTPPSPQSPAVDSLNNSMCNMQHALSSTSTAPHVMPTPPRHGDPMLAAFGPCQGMDAAYPECDMKLRKRRTRRAKKEEAEPKAAVDSDDDDGVPAEVVQQFIPQLSLRALPADMFEDREERRAQRKHQVDLGRQTPGYSLYLTAVPKHERQLDNPNHPVTPRVDVRAPRRQWKKACSAWRQQLHLWDADPHPADMADPALPTLGEVGLESVPEPEQ